MQILRNAPATLELQVFQSGTLTNLDASPSLALTDANGTSVSVGSVSTPGTGIYRATLQGQEDLKTIKAVWSGALSGDSVSFTQYYEIVGSLLFTEVEARGARFTGQQAPLSDESTFPDATIASARQLITDQFESKTKRSWITRYCRMRMHGDGSREISLYRGHPRDVDGNESGGPGRLWDIQRIISVSIDGTAHADFELHGRRLINTTGSWPRATYASPFPIIVEYEYGHEDLEARENGLRMVVANLLPSDVPSYSQNFTTPEGTVTYPPGGLVWPAKTREWLDRHPARRIPVVA